MGPFACGKGVDEGTFVPSDTYCTLEMNPIREAKPCSAHSVEESMPSESTSVANAGRRCSRLLHPENLSSARGSTGRLQVFVRDSQNTWT